MRKFVGACKGMTAAGVSGSCVRVLLSVRDTGVRGLKELCDCVLGEVRAQLEWDVLLSRPRVDLDDWGITWAQGLTCAVVHG